MRDFDGEPIRDYDGDHTEKSIDEQVIDLVERRTKLADFDLKMGHLDVDQLAEITGVYLRDIQKAVFMADPIVLETVLRSAEEWGMDINNLLWTPWLGGHTLLSWICRNHHNHDKDVSLKMADTVMKHMTNIDCINTLDGYKTPLIYAIESGDVDLVKLVVSYKPDFDIKMRNGKTAIWLVMELYGKNSLMMTTIGLALFELEHGPLNP